MKTGTYIAREAFIGWQAYCSVCGMSLHDGGVIIWHNDGRLETMNPKCASPRLKFVRLPRKKGYRRNGCKYVHVIHDGDIQYEIIRSGKRSKGPVLFGVFRNGWELLEITDNRWNARRRVAEEVLGKQKDVSRNLESYGKSVAIKLHTFYIEENCLEEAAALVAQPITLSALLAKEQVMAKVIASRQAATPAPARRAAAAAQPAAQPAPAPAPAESQPAPAAPPKPRNSATEEEVQAAVEGILGPRETPGDPNQEALTSRDERNRPGGRPLGVNTGLPILLAWCLAFQENEKLKARDPNNPTDEESIIGSLGHQPDEAITAFMKSEFPGRETPAFDHPQSCRNDYNSGKFTKLLKPKFQSQRYDVNGAVMVAAKRGFQKKDAAAAPVAEPAAAPAAPAPAKRAAVAPKTAPAPAPAPAAAPARRAVARKPAAATA